MHVNVIVKENKEKSTVCNENNHNKFKIQGKSIDLQILIKILRHILYYSGRSRFTALPRFH